MRILNTVSRCSSSAALEDVRELLSRGRADPGAGAANASDGQDWRREWTSIVQDVVEKQLAEWVQQGTAQGRGAPKPICFDLTNLNTDISNRQTCYD